MVFLFAFEKTVVTGKSARTLIIPMAITLLYLPNIIAGYVQFANITAIIGTKGKSAKKDLIIMLNVYSNTFVLNELCQILPIIVSDGLLVGTFRSPLKKMY